MPASAQLDLEGKAEQAFIAWLKTRPLLSARRIVSAADESAKENGTITVKATRGEESTATSGIWVVNVAIEYTQRLKKAPGTSSLADYRAVRAAIAESLEVQWRILCKRLTEIRNDWHCYYIKLVSTNVDPQEGQHHLLFGLQIDAMPITFNQALKTPNPRVPNTI